MFPGPRGSSPPPLPCQRHKTVYAPVPPHQRKGQNRGIGNTRFPQVERDQPSESGKMIWLKGVARRRSAVPHATRGNANAPSRSVSGNRERFPNAGSGRAWRGIGNGRSGKRERSGTGQREQKVGGTRTPTRVNRLIIHSVFRP
jgi:hypothetical protein